MEGPREVYIAESWALLPFVSWADLQKYRPHPDATHTQTVPIQQNQIGLELESETDSQDRFYLGSEL